MSNEVRDILRAAAAIGERKGLNDLLQKIVEVAAKVANAKFGALGVIGRDETMESFLTTGITETERAAIGELPHGKGVLGLLIREPRTIRIPNLTTHSASAGFPPNHPPMTSFLGVPIVIGDRIYGNLYLCDKVSSPEFSEDDEETVLALASYAAVAINNTRTIEAEKQLNILEYRESLARDLHDTVIQRLYAAGFRLARFGKEDPAIGEIVDDLDDIVKEVRNAIADLNQTFEPSLRKAIIAAAHEIAEPAAAVLKVTIDGPIDTVVSDRVGRVALSATRELVSNAVRHADASTITLRVSAGDEFSVLVSDDGLGFDVDAVARSGLDNLAKRASEFGGAMVIESSSDGSSVCWTVPLIKRN